MYLTLDADEARELAYGMTNDDRNLTIEANEYMESGRWMSVHRLVLKDTEGRLWSATYRQGLTEMQDSGPFENEAAVRFQEVEKVPVVTYEYRVIA